MALAKHDLLLSCFGNASCLGLCAICETVMALLNTGIEYSEDHGQFPRLEVEYAKESRKSTKE